MNLSFLLKPFYKKKYTKTKSTELRYTFTVHTQYTTSVPLNMVVYCIHDYPIVSIIDLNPGIRIMFPWSNLYAVLFKNNKDSKIHRKGQQ